MLQGPFGTEMVLVSHARLVLEVVLRHVEHVGVVSDVAQDANISPAASAVHC